MVKLLTYTSVIQKIRKILADYKISIVQKLILLLFFLSVQFIYATDLENPFIKNKGQLPQKVIAKVCLPGGALFIEKGIFTYHFYNQQKLADIHNHRTTDRSIKAHAFKVIFKNSNENIESFLEEKSEFFENYYLGNNQNNCYKNNFSIYYIFISKFF